MAKTRQPVLPEPRQATPDKMPSTGRGTYAALTRAADRHLARAEAALRSASLLWADVDRGLEQNMEDLAERVFAARNESVETVADLYGDRLNEGAV